MPRPRSKPMITISPNLSAEEREDLKNKSFDEVLASFADQRKVELAMSIITSIAEKGDSSALKILQTTLDKQGFENKELPISDARFKEIIKVAAGAIA